MQTSNPFSLAYYRSIIELAQRAGYRFQTIREFLVEGAPAEGVFILRHDLDTKPATTWPMLDCERELGVRSTVFVRVMANDYNALGYTVLPKLLAAESEGFEIGLHSNFVEYATIAGLDPLKVLAGEAAALKAFLRIDGVACHRDVNYAFNSLPWLQANWREVSVQLGLAYEAYADSIMQRILYVNEGLNPHLCWRRQTPEEAIGTGRSICLLTHGHWWYRDHPFEA
jgi:hypothetical protein